MTCPTTAIAKTYHRRLWHWLSMNVGARKKDWPEWKFNGGAVTDFDTRCFACGEHKYKCDYCRDDCPLYESCIKGALHTRWKNLSDTLRLSDDYEEQRALVEDIKLLAQEMRNAWE